MNIEPIKALYPDASYLSNPTDVRDSKTDTVDVYPYLKQVVFRPAIIRMDLKETARRFKILLTIRRAGYELVSTGYKLGSLCFRERIQ